MTTDDKVLYLMMINKEFGLLNFEFAGEININYNETKEDIYIELKEVLNDKSEIGSLIAFETNICNISPLKIFQPLFKIDLSITFSPFFQFFSILAFQETHIRNNIIIIFIWFHFYHIGRSIS